MRRVWSWVQPAHALSAPDLEDLRGAAIAELAYVMLALAWLAALRGLWGRRFDTLPVALLLAAGSLGPMRLRRSAFLAARCLLILSLIAATAYETWLFPAGIARHYFPITVVVSSLLVSHLSVFAVASLAALAYVAVTGLHGAKPFDAERVLHPVFLIYLTAFAVWLGSRQLHVALAWMQNSYVRARDMLEELRNRRAVLARTVKALEEAYGRIETMNYALIEARSAAEEARRLKAEFAANISHELRTPLSLIIGFSETMANAPETYGDMAWPPSLRGDVQQIYRSSCHLSSLVDDILDLSALDVRRLGLVVEELGLGDVIDEAVSVMGALFRAKGLYLQVALAPDLPHLRVDATRIRQVLLNLLSNASRYTRQGGVTISAQLAGREVRVAVADTGVGIAAQDVPKVFEEFRQLDGSTRRQHGGTGLGVPLSKRLVELHGGRMWLESTPGQGTTFFFSLPVSPHPATTDGGAAQLPGCIAAGQPGGRKPLLVAEPNPSLLRMLRRHITGYQVTEVSAPEELPSLADRLQPSALLVDSQEADAFASLRAWSAGAPADLAVIAFATQGAVGDASAIGASGYLVKPLARQQLLDALAQLGSAVRKVLVVDDDPQFVELVSRVLQSAGRGYQPIKAFGGEEALARMRRQRPDAALVDLGMPGVDGLAVLAAMRDDPALEGIPAIVISAREHPGGTASRAGHTLALARKQGFSAAELLNCLQALLPALPARVVPGSEPLSTPTAAPGGQPAS